MRLIIRNSFNKKIFSFFSLKIRQLEIKTIDRILFFLSFVFNEDLHSKAKI